MILKQFKNSSTNVWSPQIANKTLYASGLLEGIHDDNFSNSSSLSINDINLSNPNKLTYTLGKINSSVPFSKLVWSLNNNSEYSYGMIAGGMSDGTITLWNPKTIIKKNSQSNPLINNFVAHKYNIHSLEFHPKNYNLLGSGSINSEIKIWDINYMDEISPININESSYNSNINISIFSWNPKVEHIFATNGDMGTIKIWDMRTKKSIMSLRHANSSNPNKKVCFAWNPQQSRQLITLFGDSMSCGIWDLKMISSPISILKNGHSDDILDVCWNKFDNNIITTTGQDNKLCIWNNTNRKMMKSLIFEEGTNYHLNWSPTIPSIFMSNSISGYVSVRSLEYINDSYVPKWCKKKLGAKFGFSNKLLKLNKNNNIGIYTSKGSEEPASILSNFVNVNENNINEYCCRKMEKVKTDKEKEIWKFINISLDKINKNRNKNLLLELGFDTSTKEQQNSELKNDISVDEEQEYNTKNKINQEYEDDEDFFDNIGKNENNIGTSSINKNETNGNTVFGDENIEVENASVDFNNENVINEKNHDEIYKKIKNSLIIGNFEEAANICFNEGLIADSLIISSCDPDIWKKTQKRFFNSHTNKFMKNILYYVITNDIESLVMKSNLDDWKETLGVILTFALTDNSKRYCGLLGDRLFQEKILIEQALICYICSLNIEKASKMIFLISLGVKNKLIAFHDAIEKIYILSKATNSDRNISTDFLLKNYLKYAEVLCVQCSIESSQKFLNNIYTGDKKNDAINIFLNYMNQISIKSIPNKNTPKNQSSITNYLTNKPNQNKVNNMTPSFNPPAREIPFSSNKLPPKINYKDNRQPKKKSDVLYSQIPLPNKTPVINNKEINKLSLNSQTNQNYTNKSNFQSFPSPIKSIESPKYNKKNIDMKYIPPANNNLRLKEKISNVNIANNDIKKMNYSEENKRDIYPENFNQQNYSYPLPIERSKQNSTSSNYNTLGMMQSKMNVKNSTSNNVNKEFIDKDIKNYNIKSIYNPISNTTKKNNYVSKKNSTVIKESSLNLEDKHQKLIDSYINIVKSIEVKELVGMEKRKVNDVYIKIDNLRNKLGKGEVSDEFVEIINGLFNDLSKKSYLEAKEKHIDMVTKDWDSHKNWLPGLNTLILLSKKYL